MPSTIAIFLLALLAAAPLVADDPPKPATPAVAGQTFRFAFQQYDSGKQLVGRGEVVSSRGRIYYFEEGSKEVVILEPAKKAAHLVHRKLGVAADLTYRDLDAALAQNREDHRKAVEAHAKSASRAERVDSEMRRDMSDPRFKAEFDEATRTLRLSNPTAQVEARGEPDDDAARLATIAEALGVIAKLRSYRDPDNLRHFIEVEALSALAEGRKLRPAEMTYFFRLAGPPEKHRWAFTLIPEVSDKDRQGLDNLDAGLVNSRHLPFDSYDRRIDPDELK